MISISGEPSHGTLTDRRRSFSPSVIARDRKFRCVNRAPAIGRVTASKTNVISLILLTGVEKCFSYDTSPKEITTRYRTTREILIQRNNRFLRISKEPAFASILANVKSKRQILSIDEIARPSNRRNQNKRKLHLARQQQLYGGNGNNIVVAFSRIFNSFCFSLGRRFRKGIPIVGTPIVCHQKCLLVEPRTVKSRLSIKKLLSPSRLSSTG